MPSPDLWKIARITPILKGEKVDKSNHRVISLLPVIAKLFDKLVANQVNIWFITMFSSDQSAYRSLYSTVTRLLKTLMTGTAD